MTSWGALGSGSMRPVVASRPLWVPRRRATWRTKGARPRWLEAIASNRVRGVRCALCWNVESARLSRSHNDANMLSLGERMLGEAEALAILDAWLDTPFEGGRHARRIAQLDAPE